MKSWKKGAVDDGVEEWERPFGGLFGVEEDSEEPIGMEMIEMGSEFLGLQKLFLDLTWGQSLLLLWRCIKTCAV